MHRDILAAGCRQPGWVCAGISCECLACLRSSRQKPWAQSEPGAVLAQSISDFFCVCVGDRWCEENSITLKNMLISGNKRFYSLYSHIILLVHSLQ